MKKQIVKAFFTLIAIATAFFMLVAFSATASAITTVTIDFEDLDNYDYIGTHYPGVTFSPEARILSKGGNLNYYYYPPHSGLNVFYNRDNANTRIKFDHYVSRVCVWYTSPYEGNIDAYDGEGTLIASTHGGPNLQSTDYLEVRGSNIAYVIVHDRGNFIAYDDLEYDTADVHAPEFASIAIPAVAVLGLFLFFNHRKRR